MTISFFRRNAEQIAFWVLTMTPALYCYRHHHEVAGYIHQAAVWMGH